MRNKISLSPKFKISNLIKIIINYRNFNQKNLYKKLYYSSNCINYGTSTWSILKIYQFFKSNKKNILLIPDYICNDSLSLLRLNKARIIFYKFDSLESTTYINKLLNEDILILLFVNYFGENKKLSKKLMDILNEKKIIIVEDNTHCINSKTKIQSDVEIYSPHKLFGIDNGSIIKFKYNKVFRDFLDFYSKDLKGINNQFKNFFRFCFFIFKKEITKIIGYRYPILNFRDSDQYLVKRNHHIGTFSNSLLEIYNKDISIYKRTRISNYYLWKNNLNLILPFLKMERINYCPYLGIAKFKISKERIKILKKYNLYGLPIGTWPDLPPEVTTNKIYINAVKKFKTQITLPLHQDISPQDITECIKNSFEKYVNSFNFIYDKDLNQVIIFEDKINIGSIHIIDNDINKKKMMKLEFKTHFLKTYINSKQFIYIFSINILSKLKINKSISICVPIKYHSYLNQNKLINYEDFSFILPLNINNTKIKNLIHIMLEKTSNNSKPNIINYEINFINSENIIMFKLFNENQKQFDINIFIEKNRKYINILDVNMLKEFESPLFLLYELPIFLKDKKFEYLKINPNIIKTFLNYE